MSGNSSRINTLGTDSEKDIIDMILGPNANYDNRLRPTGENGTGDPVIVTVNILVRSISKIDDVNMEYSCQITFREQWKDVRLSYNSTFFQWINLPDPQQIWRPDLFFYNEKQGHFHNIVMPNVLLRLYPDGRILYSVRLSLVLSCPMALQYYPLDKQYCDIEMGSYGYTTDDIIFLWKQNDPIQKKSGLELPSFTLGDEITTTYCTSNTNTGAYSCIKGTLELTRQFSYYLLQLYIPSYMLVIVSWVSFWLDKEAVPARVSLGVTTLLTMARRRLASNSKLAPACLLHEAIDHVGLASCLTFIFGALAQFALVNYAARPRQPQKSFFNNDSTFGKHQEAGYDSSDLHIDPAARLRNMHGEFPRCCSSFLSRYQDRSKRIDVMSRIMFPTGFCLFNIAYWAGYLLPYKGPPLPGK
ncbi:PREDICTED: LOW QUALITY PROTEIN: glutamate-gated chloride channel-like [Priapulus caudatus]|uniref:LOW QUALITY PROTEIN: glutamate-gated chloride channel-like n=1 Tax=Priapulus caudatus TaxID=37621 RepID=A0ABM1E235_PRICU|nr:PREDICTED: LOW QUALITY PROTEIN: glutamate-gated chloride channel-like [Priapulus caudatus]